MDNIISSLISGLIGGIAVAGINYYLNKKKEIELRFNELMEDKYRSLLVFMACVLDIEKRRYFSLNEQVPNTTKGDYMNQIKEYYYHSLLYSPDTVIISLKAFIDNPTKETYIKTAIAMRKDLWSKGTKLSIKDIVLD